MTQPKTSASKRRSEFKATAYAYAASVLENALGAADVPDFVGDDEAAVKLWYRCVDEITLSLRQRAATMDWRRHGD